MTVQEPQQAASAAQMPPSPPPLCLFQLGDGRVVRREDPQRLKCIQDLCRDRLFLSVLNYLQIDPSRVKQVSATDSLLSGPELQITMDDNSGQEIQTPPSGSPFSRFYPVVAYLTGKTPNAPSFPLDSQVESNNPPTPQSQSVIPPQQLQNSSSPPPARLESPPLSREPVEPQQELTDEEIQRITQRITDLERLINARNRHQFRPHYIYGPVPPQVPQAPAGMSPASPAGVVPPPPAAPVNLQQFQQQIDRIPHQIQDATNPLNVEIQRLQLQMSDTIQREVQASTRDLQQEIQRLQERILQIPEELRRRVDEARVQLQHEMQGQVDESLRPLTERLEEITASSRGIQAQTNELIQNAIRPLAEELARLREHHTLELQALIRDRIVPLETLPAQLDEIREAYQAQGERLQQAETQNQMLQQRIQGLQFLFTLAVHVVDARAKRMLQGAIQRIEHLEHNQRLLAISNGLLSREVIMLEAIIMMLLLNHNRPPRADRVRIEPIDNDRDIGDYPDIQPIAEEPDDDNNPPSFPAPLMIEDGANNIQIEEIHDDVADYPENQHPQENELSENPIDSPASTSIPYPYESFFAQNERQRPQPNSGSNLPRLPAPFQSPFQNFRNGIRFQQPHSSQNWPRRPDFPFSSGSRLPEFRGAPNHLSSRFVFNASQPRAHASASPFSQVSRASRALYNRRVEQPLRNRQITINQYDPPEIRPMHKQAVATTAFNLLRFFLKK